jgi:hypothetical protein
LRRLSRHKNIDSDRSSDNAGLEPALFIQAALSFR